MKSQLLFAVLFAGASCVCAQEKGDVIYRTAGPGMGTIGAAEAGARTVTGAPYTATTNNEFVQVLGDGNRIVRSTTGTTARDSQGRTRRDAELPVIGNLTAANAPHFVFIQDPVAQTSYTLNLTEKTAEKMEMPTAGSDSALVKMKLDAEAKMKSDLEVRTLQGPEFAMQKPIAMMDKAKAQTLDEAGEVSTEDLGSQMMEGVLATGTRTTRTIAAGQIGNEKPISIVTEVWTSPELKTVVMSKRSDPRIGDQTFRLTNITRAEPDPSLFSVPSDFKVIEGPGRIIYRMKQ